MLKQFRDEQLLLGYYPKPIDKSDNKIYKQKDGLLNQHLEKLGEHHGNIGPYINPSKLTS